MATGDYGAYISSPFLQRSKLLQRQAPRRHALIAEEVSSRSVDSHPRTLRAKTISDAGCVCFLLTLTKLQLRGVGRSAKGPSFYRYQNVFVHPSRPRTFTTLTSGRRPIDTSIFKARPMELKLSLMTHIVWPSPRVFLHPSSLSPAMSSATCCRARRGMSYRNSTPTGALCTTSRHENAFQDVV